MSSNQIVMSFHSDAVKDDTLLVAAAEGVETLAQPFRFDLDLVSADPGLDLSAILRVNARLSLNRTMDLGDGRSGDIAYDYHGIVTEFRQLGRVGNSRYRYRAVLRPHLWKLACTRRSRIYTDKSVPDLLRAVLDEAGIAFTFTFADEKIYPINPYVVQYEETDLDFISRWMEHVGISYYYDAKGDLGTLVVIDNARGYASINPHDERVVFDDQAAAGVWSSGRHQCIRSLEVEETRLPKRVQLKEYNCEAPSNELKYEVEVDAKGFGTWYEYNSNYRTESEAKFLLGVRKGFWLGQRRRLHGQADHRSFQPGRTFTLTEHFNPNISDSSYALTEVCHHLSQANGDDVGTTGEYTCDFIAMPADLPHRPERITAWPSIHGVVHARIAGGALGFAELDEMGRYKVDVDYDLNDQTIGKVRMAQPSVGENAGMHFPLRKHTEVLLGHIDGDPDKPVILGAVHDAEKVNLLDKVRDPLGTKSRIKSQGGNIIEMEDDADRKHLVMANGNYNAVQSFGRPSYMQPRPGAENSSAHNAGRPQQRSVAAKPATAIGPVQNALADTDAVRKDNAASSSSFAATSQEIAQATADATAKETAAKNAREAAVTAAAAAAAAPSNSPLAAKAQKAEQAAQIAELTAAAAATALAELTPDLDVMSVSSYNTGDDAVVEDFYASAANNYAEAKTAAGTDAAKKATASVPWGTGYLDFSAWSATKNDMTRNNFITDCKDLYSTRPKIVQGTDYDLNEGKVPQSYKGKAIVDNAGKNKAIPPGVTPAASGMLESDDPHGKFANFYGLDRGIQTVIFGESLNMIYGDSWTRQYGTSYNWKSGDVHNFQPNGTTYNYFSGDSVTWLHGPNNEWEYAQDKKSYSYAENVSSYDKVNVKSLSESEAENTESTETVFGLAKSTARIFRKEETSHVGFSLALIAGGPQAEFSANGPKLTVEGAISATFTIAAAFELTTGYKCEVNLAAKHEFNPISSLELKTDSQKLKAKEDSATALETTKKALGIDDIVTKIDKTAMKLKRTGAHLGMVSNSLMNVEGAHMHNGFIVFT